MSRFLRELLNILKAPNIWLPILAWGMATIFTGVACPLAMDWLIAEAEFSKDKNLKLVAQFLKYVTYGLAAIFLLALFYKVYQIIDSTRKRCRNLQSYQTETRLLGRRPTAQGQNLQRRMLPVVLVEPQQQQESIQMTTMRLQTELSQETLEQSSPSGGSNQSSPSGSPTSPQPSSSRIITRQVTRSQPRLSQPRRSLRISTRRRNTEQTTV